MQKIAVLCVGKLKEKFYLDAVAEYTKRLQRCCKLEVIELPESKLPEEPSPAQIQQALDTEAAAISAKLPRGGALVAMCIEGSPCSSEEMSRKMQQLAVSKSTARRYLDYLASIGEVVLQIEYGTVGRPTYRYRRLR